MLTTLGTILHCRSHAMYTRFETETKFDFAISFISFITRVFLLRDRNCADESKVRFRTNSLSAELCNEIGRNDLARLLRNNDDNN